MTVINTNYHFEVYGLHILLSGATGNWQAYFESQDGKRRKAEFIVPEFLQDDELLQYLMDLFHERASPQHDEPRIIISSAR